MRRLKRLYDSGVAKIIVAVDRFKLGHHVDVLISLRVDMDKVESVAHELAKYSEISYVGLTTGEFDLLLHGHFTSNDDLLEFMEKRIGRLEGVRNSQILSVLKVIKRAYSWIPVNG